MGIGRKLSDLINERGTTVSDIAQRVDVPASTIYSMIARDSKKADIDVLIKIAKALGVTAEYFCNEENGIPVTIAAHRGTDDLLDGLTDDEKEDIAEYIEFIKNKRK